MGLLALAACAAPPPPVPVTEPTVPPVAGIAAEAVRLRTDEAVGGQVHLRITDTGTAAFTVTSVALDSPGFRAVAPHEVRTEFPPGRTFALPVQYGEVACDADVEPAAARLTVVRPDGAVEDLRVPLAGDDLARVHAEECAVAAALAAVGVTVEGFSGTGVTLGGEVVVRRRAADGPVRVLALQRSVVLEPVPGRELPEVLAAGDEELRLPVTVRSASCEPHVLAETKQPFVFPLRVQIGAAEEVAVDLPLDDGQRRQLQELLGRVC
ncbi:hypothetical protein JD78_03081 [Modestobacter roseus]|uniref:Uncharacterized protein n=1 Tax=Modestobacter roseus TaxID=1181884 RepID=A0A562IUK9_9ACTN|nr:hypothetical protein JD78_03081 [Modestobacter roseus]